MKKILLLLSIFSVFLSFAQLQIPKEFNFNTTFVDAENQFVVLPVRENDKEFNVGIPYFDQTAGYSFKLFGTLIPENEKLKFKNSEANIIARWENLGLKVAVIPQEKIKEWQIPDASDFLKNHQTSRPENDVLVDKYSFMNGAGSSDLALQGLEKLKAKNVKTEKFFFELAFAYNALENFSKAEETITDAAKNGLSNELLIKEKHYALLHQNKLSESADYLKNNFKFFKSTQYKSESILNQISKFYNASDFENTKNWIDYYKKEIGSDQYKEHVDKFENALKQQKK